MAAGTREDALLHPPESFRGSYGSTRTIVGFGIPAAPEYATEPRYFVPGARPLNVRLIVPLAPSVAEAGALTVMLPAGAEPSNHENNVKFAVPGTPNPCT